jgi:hypothetical protein
MGCTVSREHDRKVYVSSETTAHSSEKITTTALSQRNSISSSKETVLQVNITQALQLSISPESPCNDSNNNIQSKGMAVKSHFQKVILASL